MKKYKQAPPSRLPGNEKAWTEETHKYMLPGKIYRDTILETDFALTAADDTYEASGLSITLPQEGFYLLFVDTHAHLSATGTPIASITGALFADGVLIEETQHLLAVTTNASETHKSSFWMDGYLCTKKGTVIELYVKSNLDSGGWALKELHYDDRGRTHLSCVYYGKLDLDTTSVV